MLVPLTVSVWRFNTMRERGKTHSHDDGDVFSGLWRAKCPVIEPTTMPSFQCYEALVLTISAAFTACDYFHLHDASRNSKRARTVQFSEQPNPHGIGTH